jgi:hypothetical protein
VAVKDWMMQTECPSLWKHKMLRGHRMSVAAPVAKWHTRVLIMLGLCSASELLRTDECPRAVLNM